MSKALITLLFAVSLPGFANTPALKTYSRALEALYQTRIKNITNVTELHDSLTKAEDLQASLDESTVIDMCMKNRYNAEALYVIYLILSLEKPADIDTQASQLVLSYKSIVKCLKTYNADNDDVYKKTENTQERIRSFMSDIENVALNNNISLPEDLMLVSPLSIPQLPDNLQKYSSRYILNNDVLLEDDEEGVTLAAIDKRIVSALDKCGYDEYSYFAFGDMGYALVTKTERFNHDGSYATANRWNTNKGVVNAFSFIDIVKAIFFATPSHYRFMIFLVTPEGRVHDGKGADPALYKEGIDRLPKRYGDLPYTDEYRCSVMIYEFERSDIQAENVKFIDRSGLSATDHLNKSNILQSFNNH